jgi:hypothetical protein
MIAGEIDWAEYKRSKAILAAKFSASLNDL